MSRPQMRSCRGPWIGLVVRVEQIAARYKWTIPVTFQIPWGTMPPMPSTVTIRGSSTGEPLAISILQQSPLILTQVRFLNYMILSIDSISLIWNIITIYQCKWHLFFLFNGRPWLLQVWVSPLNKVWSNLFSCNDDSNEVTAVFCLRLLNSCCCISWRERLAWRNDIEFYCFCNLNGRHSTNSTKCM